MPKCEIFDRSDFPDFYTIKSSWVGDLVLCARISSRRACSVHASVPDAHAEGIQNEHLKNRETDAHAQGAHQFLKRTLRVRISS